MKPKAKEFKKRISSWSDLACLVQHFSYFNAYDWLFRGVTEERHSLIPKIGRLTTRKRKNGVHVPYRVNDERAVLSMFKQQARAYLSTPPNKELEWLAIAQHNGLATRFLDWTDSILVAAWFAVEPGGANNFDSAIWVTTGIPYLALDYSGNPLDLKKPYAYRPPHISPRISAQGSVLMLCPKPTQELELNFCEKIIISREFQFTIKKRLNACGINRRNLFPDLVGLAEHLTWIYKNDWLAGYRPESVANVEIIADVDETSE